jgi:hypothetical protein
MAQPAATIIPAAATMTIPFPGSRQFRMSLSNNLRIGLIPNGIKDHNVKRLHLLRKAGPPCTMVFFPTTMAQEALRCIGGFLPPSTR